MSKLIGILEVLILSLGTALVVYQFTESNRLNWLTILEANSKSLSEMVIKDKSLQCIYEYDIVSVDKECAQIIKTNESQRKIILYLDEVLDMFIEVIKYDEKYSGGFILQQKQNQFMDFHRDWYEGIFRSEIINKHFSVHVDKDKVSFIENYIKESK